MSEKISGLIITFNEEKNIQAVLNCFDFCDEILVIDSFSSDRTHEIASAHPKTRVISHPFTDFTQQRNFALSQARNEWVLFLDGDERIPEALRSEIIETVQNKSSKDAYLFYRLFFFEKKPIKYSATQNDKNFRLFRKSKCHYVLNKKVHETLHVNGTVGILKNKLLHYSVENVEFYKNKMKYYGFLKAHELFEKGKPFNYHTQILKTGFKFFKIYFLKLGFLDGKEGLEIAQLQSYYVFQTYESLHDLWKNKK